MTIDCISEIPGAAELSNWFGGFPGFHDAYAELQIFGEGSGLLKVKAWKMTKRVDANGHFILEKQFAATFFFDKITAVSLSDFQPGRAILYGLDIRKNEKEFQVQLESSYGFNGSINAEHIRIEFQPEPGPA